MAGNSDRTGDFRRVPLNFKRVNGKIDDSIDALMEQVMGVEHQEIIREMIIAALKAGQEGESKADLKLMNSSLKEMRYTTKIFAPYRGIRKVTVFGSARTMSNEPIYKMAKKFGHELAKAGYMVITGGGPGIMQAVNEGAGAEKSFGVNIRLPFEQKPNPVLEGLNRNINYKYFFNRKVAFVKESDAVALFPGGFGTLDEAMEILTLVQTGKRYPLPIVMMDLPGGNYWVQWERFARDELLSRGNISDTDFALYECVESAEEGVENIRRFYSRYHSLRYVGPKTVIRLKKPPAQERIDELRQGFQDIITPGGDLALSQPLPEEQDDTETLSLPRVVIDFDRKDFGRLRQLIDELNKA
jgi:uncharacterized protein (TIGR00730 family)